MFHCKMIVQMLAGVFLSMSHESLDRMSHKVKVRNLFFPLWGGYWPAVKITGGNKVKLPFVFHREF